MSSAQLKPIDDEVEEFVDELKPGTELLHGQYKIASFLNAGGFGITYLAHDSLDRKIVIKECFPGAFCRRSRLIVQARSRSHQNELESIVRLFIQEARSLAKLQHPNIVGVHQVFEDNKTAYMALDFVDGRDMLDMLEDSSWQADPLIIKEMLVKLLGAIKFIHNEGMLHRDISPDNILIESDGNPILIDFGAAREQASKQSRVLSALRVVKDGYSPQEFYIAGSEQGPSSDLYALAASFYHIIVGETPPDSQRRLAAAASGDTDPYVPLDGRVKGYDEHFLASIDKAIAILPKDRMQSAQDWLDAIEGKVVVTAATAATPKANAADVETKKKSPKLALLLGSVAVIGILASAFLPSLDSGTSETQGVDVPLSPVAPSVTAETASTEDISVAPVTNEETAGAEVEPVSPSTAEDPVVTEDAADASVTPETEAAGTLSDGAAAGEAATEVVSVDETASVGVSNLEAADVRPELGELDALDGATLPISQIAQARIELPLETPQAIVGQSDPVEALAQPLDQALAGIAPATVAVPTDAGNETARIAAELETARIAAEQETASIAAGQETASVAAGQETASIAAGQETASVATEQETAPIAADAVEAMAAAATELGLTGTTESQLANLAPPASEIVAGYDLIEPSSEDQTEAPNVAEIEPAAEETVDLASASTNTAVDAPVSAVSADPVVSQWSVALPFEADAFEANKIGEITGVAWDWMVSGQEILTINGVAIDKIDDIPAILRTITELGEQTNLEISFGVGYDDKGKLLERTAVIPVVQETVLLNGFRFATRYIDGAWQTRIVELGTQDTDLQIGDQIIAYIPTNERLKEREDFGQIVEREISRGVSQFSLAVQRDGSMWVGTLNYQVTSN